jgi:hypothetical protein
VQAPHRERRGDPRGVREGASIAGKISDFCRAYLNQWKPKPKEAEETALGDWARCGTTSVDPMPKVAAVGVAVSLDRQWSSIGTAGILDDDRILVGASDRRAGTAWLADEVARIQTAHDCAVVVDEKGPAGDLIEDLEVAGVRVTRAKLGDYIDACAALLDRVRDQTVVHLRHPELDEAVLGARWRMVGDRRAFGRKTSVSEVSMLEAVTLAAWGSRGAGSVYEGRELVVM